METVLDNMGLIVGSIIIAIFIIVMFSYVIKVVKFIKTDKIQDAVKRKKIKTNPSNNRARKINKENWRTNLKQIGNWNDIIIRP